MKMIFVLAHVLTFIVAINLMVGRRRSERIAVSILAMWSIVIVFVGLLDVSGDRVEQFVGWRTIASHVGPLVYLAALIEQSLPMRRVAHR